MKVKIQTVHFDADYRLEEFVHERMNKLIKRYKYIIDANVTLRLDKSETKENKVAEIRVNVPGEPLYVKKQSKTFEEAVSDSVDALHRMMEKFKDKR
jgi:putative sigma-54 modulation protein